MGTLRFGLVGFVLASAVAAPLGVALALHGGPVALASASAAGLRAAVDSVGWVLLPQVVLAVAVLGVALRRVAAGASGRPLAMSPGWLDPAVESALLLGMLGTISGMVSGFVGLSPQELQPGPLVYALGQALRSSFVGFAIALVGVWAKVPAQSVAPA